MTSFNFGEEGKKMFVVYFALCVVYFVAVEASIIPEGAQKTPVILVPGDGGSQFEAKLTGKPSVVHYWCERRTDDWFPLWLNIELLAPYVLDCTVDNLRLVYNNHTRKSENSPGVIIRQPAFGNTSAVEWLDESQIYETDYFYPIAQALVQAGWTRNVNIRGAPYDFRKAPNENQKFISDFKQLIQETYAKNGNKKVVIIAHSLGNLYTTYLLSQQSQSWKDKYISSYINMAGPFGGAAKIMRLMASGDNLGVFVVNPLTARPMQRSMPSSAWLMPYETLWSDSEILVSSPKQNYTVKDYRKFFEDINFMDGYEMRKDTEGFFKQVTKPPGVPVHCLHGINVTTPTQFVWTAKTWYDYQPKVIYGNGDGTVNLRSLQVCLNWRTKQGQMVHHQTFSGIDHMQILKHQPAVDYVVRVLKSS